MSGIDDRPHISWLPVETETDSEYAPPEFPLSTFGGGWHEDASSEPVPELPGTPSLDPEIVPLVLALNRAGIETIQSCQDIGGATSPDPVPLPDEVPRFGCVVVRWDVFPALHRLLMTDTPHGPVHASREGWLFSACSDFTGPPFVSVLFPWRDLGTFIQLCGEQA
jgi:hypothetical protein